MAPGLALVALLTLAAACGAPGTPGPEDTATTGPSPTTAPHAAASPAAPTAAPAPGENATVASPTPVPTCSGAAVAGPLPAQAQLPAPVARTREAIFAAATACDFARLGELAGPTLRYTFGEHEDAVAYWRAAEERGEKVLARMAEVLLRAPAEQAGLWTWPGFFLRPTAEWTAEDRAEAERLLADDELAGVDEMGQYLGYRIGIAADGRWQYFVAGD